MPIQDHFVMAPALAIFCKGGKKVHCAGIFLSRFPLLGERSSGCGDEMHCWSCPLSGAEIYFSTARLLMVSGSVSLAVLLPGAEMCYSTAAF